MNIPAVVYEYIVHEEKYPDGAVILREGGHGNWAYVILNGQVKIKRKTARGEVTADILKAGDIFGDRGLFNPKKLHRSATVTAQGDVYLGLLDSDKIQKDFYALPDHMQTFITTLARHLDESIDQMVKIINGK